MKKIVNPMTEHEQELKEYQALIEKLGYAHYDDPEDDSFDDDDE
mgnify:CR=1 FL=1